ncbi:MAG: hypothetical protein INF41_02900, partial [Rhodospirillaceae bacterium]|nr:hypothetical protein [Rhodospirillaceae bacterium]
MSINNEIKKNVAKVNSDQKTVFNRIFEAADSTNQKLNIFDPSTPTGESVTSVKARLVLALAMFKGLENDDINFTLVPYSYLDNLNTQLLNISKEFDKISHSFNQIESNGGIGIIDPSDQNISSQNLAYNFDLTPLMKAIDNFTDNALDSYYKLSFVINKPEYSQIAAISNEFTEVLDAFMKKKEDLDEITKSSNMLRKKIEKASSDTESQFKL